VAENVRIRGVSELAAGIRRLAGRIDRGSRDDFESVANQVAAQVQGTVPHRTGRLAGSVMAQSTSNGASVSMGAGVPYAQYVEYGGRGHPHSSQGNYLYPAAMDAGPQLEEAGQQAAQSEIRSMSWPSP
jgi:phage gpG-like protein